MSSSLNLHRVFVYGAMRKGCRDHRTLADALYMGVANYPPGHSKMVDTGNKPGLIPDSDGKMVRGELYGVDARLLTKLDNMARDPIDFMVRRKVSVWVGQPEDGRFVRAWCYFLRTPETYKWRATVGVWPVEGWLNQMQDWVAFRRDRAKFLVDLIDLGKTGPVSMHGAQVGTYYTGHNSSSVTGYRPGAYTPTPGPRDYDESAKGYKGKYPEVFKLADGAEVELTTPSGRKVTFKREGLSLMEVGSIPAPVKAEPILEGMEAEYDASGHPMAGGTIEESDGVPVAVEGDDDAANLAKQVTMKFLEDYFRDNGENDDEPEHYCG